MLELLRPKRLQVQAQVQATRLTSPHLQRITFGGPELAAFLQTDGIDTPAAWVKIFLPSGESRAYTIRSVDHSAGTMDIEFMLHTAHGASGPAATWAAQAQAGEQVVIAGPRDGGYALPDGASWLLLAGDLTAMPAIQRIAATLPPGLPAEIHVELASPDDRQVIDSTASLNVHWLPAGAMPGSALCLSLLNRPLPPGPGYIWIAGESASIRSLRNRYLQTLWLDAKRVSAKGYWKVGEAAHRDAA
ncbi:SIP domain-containing protein [Duganella sp. CY15W]|uniref:siderophore-interacting protein n=1 Tax=Duganella sp. CY15W TaxID=2692172 RepID=UPI001368D6FD|nr:siderophore-interacting protein [Duganella sp. CY15W]MYM27423.1 SIP domain-containing protein [Duganella sp. CY15W]